LSFHFTITRAFTVDALYLIALAAFVALGTPFASYHGDETNHIHNARDYITLFIDHQPEKLLVNSMWDSHDAYYRLLDSSVSRYSIGFVWHLTGMPESALPPLSYVWGASYDENFFLGLVPAGRALILFRAPSTLFFALSIVIVFALGRQFGGRGAAYFASGVYALNPALLLNGRRAMQEGPLLFFGLLTILIASEIALRREAGKANGVWRWGVLIAAGALTLASKNSGFLFTASAYLWILLPEVARRRARRTLTTALRLMIAGVLTLALFVVLHPGLWSDPLARFTDIVMIRAGEMRTQVAGDPEAPTSTARRIADLLTQPFMQPLQHYERTPRYSEEQERQIAVYNSLLLAGLRFGSIGGGVLTTLWLIGFMVNLIPNARPNRSWTLAIGLYAWLAVNVVVLMLTPLPWQRYYLPLTPVTTLFATIGVLSLFSVRAAQPQPKAA
jgi:4-amino-4-deoxy-L-arabinose transferase-like glycosyltransferase